MSPVTRLHAGAGMAAIALISVFWFSTAVSELWTGHDVIRTVKLSVLAAIPLLVFAMATAGLTGRRLAAGRVSPVIARKQRRMILIALNGLLVLVPSAIFLAWKAYSGEFDTGFYAVQVIELIAGPVNLLLLGANMRDGRRMTAKRRALKSA